ncbi:maleylpyruvate isomerase family mycothiol-dependent enzyme [Pseudonocardiaceae bacterium YIM PH 21723]|nr:maleylpyruvate isomerase family mycothiol-dependent enzyme [Pseudonocardiaceae bacterium YIM PH 21723]
MVLTSVKEQIWALVHAERAALIEDLAPLDDVRWDEPSLCAGWTVHDVAGHLVSNALATPVGFVLGLVRSRFDFERDNARGVERGRGGTPQETLDRLRAVLPRTSAPPVALDSRLVEEIVHGEDIRRPLGIRRSYPEEAVIRAIRLQARTPASFGGGKDLLTQVRLTATDADISIGTGPETKGPALDLLLTLTGR